MAANQTTPQTIVVPAIKREMLQVTIEGVSSLLCHKFSEVTKKKIEDKQQQKAQGALGARNPEQEFQDSIYWAEFNGKRVAAFPVSGIKKACVDAATFIKGVKKTQARGAFFILGDFAPIKGKLRMHESVIALPYGVRDLRYRAEFPEWSIDLKILFNPNVISAEAIVNLLENAGFAIGIGDHRPQKNGSNGMFKVKS